MVARDRSMETSGYEERLRFETLLTELSSGFINLPASRVDDVLRDAQRRVCECLRVDFSILWQLDEDRPDTLLLTHYYVAPDLQPGFPPVPPFLDARKSVSWSYGKMLKGETVVVSRHADVPAAAAATKKAWRHYGVRSIVAVPLLTGGDKTFGALSFSTIREQRTWSPEMVRRLELVAHIFSNALARKRADLQLRESEERLSMATAAAAAGLWVLNTGRTHFWINDRVAEIFGLPPGESLALERFMALVHPEDRLSVRAALARALASPETTAVEYRIVRPDGKVRWMQTRGRMAAASFGNNTRLMGLTADITDRKEREEERRRDALRLDRLVAELASARDDEQKRIASGLHDDVAQLLMAVRIKLQQAQEAGNPLLRKKRLADAVRFIDMADLSIRDLVFDLGTATLYTLGLQKALEELCEDEGDRFGVRFAFTNRMKEGPLEERKAVVLFKSTRELMFNVAKHADVPRATVTLSQRGGRVMVVVEDKGRGFTWRRDQARISQPPSKVDTKGGQAGPGTGLGLFSISKRMEGIGGGMTAESPPGGGTRVTLWVPAGTGAPGRGRRLDEPLRGRS